MKIVFVHYGEYLPRYLIQNLKVTKADFPSAEVILITDSNLRIQEIADVSVFRSSFDLSQIPSLGILKHPKDFRDGFWFKSIYRFFSLREYMKTKPGEIFHVESDVRLSKDFPFDKFIDHELDIAFPLVDQQRGIASLLFVRNILSLDHFLSQIVSYMSIDSSETDMTLLGKYSLNFPGRVLILPIGPYEMMKFGEQRMQDGWKESTLRNIEYFGGYFDGFHFGQYLFGTDSRNSYGISYLKSKSSIQTFPKDSVKINWNQSRNFPFVSHLDSPLPLFSLHFHNKSVRMISTPRLSKSFKIKYSVGKYRFNPIIFLSLALKKMKKISRKASA